MMIKCIWKGLFFITPLFFLLIFSSVAFANGDKNSKHTVNIITWWGYLDDPQIQAEVEKNCNVNLSFDEYYSENEFLRRFSENSEDYDIAIFSETMLDVIKDKIKLKRSNLWEQSKNYNPYIRKHFIAQHFPPNVVYFAHALTGFLYNPKVININSSDTIFEIFKKAGNNIVVVIDDPVEAYKIIRLSFADTYLKYTEDILTVENFKKIKQGTQLYITNDFGKIYTKPNYAFSYIWSGEAIKQINISSKKYKFLINPKLSYITADLLGQLNNKPYVTCVSRMLTGEKVEKTIQDKYYYFSPYVTRPKSKDENFINLYNEFVKILPSATWVGPVSKESFEEKNKEWQLIKIYANS